MPRFYVDQKNDDLMIYKAKVIGNAYKPVVRDEKILSSTLDGGYECENKVTKYYYNISGLTMIITEKCDNDKSKESYELKILDEKDVTFDSKTGFSIYGIWDDIFNNVFREAKKQIEAIELIDKFTSEEYNSEEKNKTLTKKREN